MHCSWLLSLVWRNLSAFSRHPSEKRKAIRGALRPRFPTISLQVCQHPESSHLPSPRWSDCQAAPSTLPWSRAPALAAASLWALLSCLNLLQFRFTQLLGTDIWSQGGVRRGLCKSNTAAALLLQPFGPPEGKYSGDQLHARVGPYLEEQSELHAAVE